MVAVPLLTLAWVSSQAAHLVQRSMIEYGPNREYKGYLVRPAGHGPFPAMIVIHEWWGLNDNIREQSDKLADAGYVALAVDLFGKTTADPREAMRMVQGFDQAKAAAQLIASVDYVRSLPYVIPERTGSIGWCFGGGMSLRLALMDPKLAAAVIYYGQPVTNPNELAKIKAKVLGIYGEADAMITMEKVREFEKALAEAGVPHEFHTYPGAPHAFANPSGGKSYKPEAAADAWQKTTTFLEETLKLPVKH